MRCPAKFQSSYFISALTALLLIIPCLAFADNDADKSKRENSLQPGSWSLHFQLEEELSIEPFDGLIVALKRHMSRHSAIRIGFDLDLDFADGEYARNRLYADTVWSTLDRAYERNAQQIELDFMYLNYPNPGALVNFFWGVGPLVMFSRMKSKDNNYSIQQAATSVQSSDMLSRTWSGGGRGLVGVEWFVTKAISFHGEYSASFRYIHTTRESTRTREATGAPTSVDKDEGTDKEWDFEGVHVIVGISLYF
jgi:hypothetical protein